MTSGREMERVYSYSLRASTELDPSRSNGMNVSVITENRWKNLSPRVLVSLELSRIDQLPMTSY